MTKEETYQLWLKELSFTTSRSGGSGGQNVNKVETRVTLIWDLMQSSAFSAAEQAMLNEKLASFLTGVSVMQMSSEKHRTQARNKADVVAKAWVAIQQALVVPKKRKPTKPSNAAKRKRLDAKKKRSEIKHGRSFGKSDV